MMTCLPLQTDFRMCSQMNFTSVYTNNGSNDHCDALVVVEGSKG